jgi:hypothetical protein
MQGYFRWLVGCESAQNAAPLMTPAPEQAATPAPAPYYAMAATPAGERFHFFLAGRQLTRLAAAEPPDFFLSPNFYETRTIELRFCLSGKTAPGVRPPATYRALLLETAVLQRLARAVGDGGAPAADFLARALDHATVTDNPEVARILSAVPEMNGTMTDALAATVTMKVPPEARGILKVPDSVHVAVVIDDKRGEAP